MYSYLETIIEGEKEVDACIYNKIWLFVYFSDGGVVLVCFALIKAYI